MADDKQRPHTFLIDGALQCSGLDLRSAAMAVLDARYSGTPMSEDAVVEQALLAGASAPRALAAVLQEALTVGLAQVAPDIKLDGLNITTPSTTESARLNYPQE